MKLLVVGCGSIGRRHAENAAMLAETAVFDAISESAREVAMRHDLRWFDSLRNALDWGPDGVVVATPHDRHLAVANPAIEAGCDVLIEKPISPKGRP